MITTDQLTTNLKSYVNKQVLTMAKSNPVIGFMKPLITRALDKNFNKLSKWADLIADEDGNIDIENILTEMFESVMNADQFTIKSPVGDIELGGGFVKFNLPMVSKQLVLNSSDLEVFKEMLTSKT